jgi:hypothetical protein
MSPHGHSRQTMTGQRFPLRASADGMKFAPWRGGGGGASGDDREDIHMISGIGALRNREFAPDAIRRAAGAARRIVPSIAALRAWPNALRAWCLDIPLAQVLLVLLLP